MLSLVDPSETAMLAEERDVNGDMTTFAEIATEFVRGEIEEEVEEEVYYEGDGNEGSE